jgi:hypothetical protein
MAKYVDIEPVVKRLTSVCLTDDTFGLGIQMGVNHAMEIIGKARIVDAVEVVRCKDCKHYVLHALACRHENFNGIINMNGFCSYGERRTDGNTPL